MNAYVVTYDLSQPGRNYEDLYKLIKAYGTWAKITESSWAIKTEQDSKQIRDNLKSALDSNDTILVGRLGACAWMGLSKKVSDWLQTNI